MDIRSDFESDFGSDLKLDLGSDLELVLRLDLRLDIRSDVGSHVESDVKKRLTHNGIRKTATKGMDLKLSILSISYNKDLEESYGQNLKKNKLLKLYPDDYCP